MVPKSIEEAKKLGWKPIGRDELEAFRKSLPEAALQDFAAPVDCNFATDGARCGGFGDTIVCFCEKGLCQCYRRG